MSDSPRSTFQARAARSRILEGLPYPLGATWDGLLGVNFALFSAYATKSNCACSTTRACARSSGSNCRNTRTRSGTATCPTPGRHDLRLPRPRPLRATAGHRFNPNKLLIDPYAKGLVGSITWKPALFGYKMETGDDTTFDDRDSARVYPPLAGDRPCLHLGPPPKNRTCRGSGPSSTRAHVKGLTKLHPKVPEKLAAPMPASARRR